MKKITKSILVILLVLLMSANVMADVQPGRTEPDYNTDYYMIVESKAGGINIYPQPDLDSDKLNDKLIPNGTALHIEGEVEDTANNRTWGYTEYHGMYGYAPLDECRPAESRKEAIDSELYIAGKEHVNYNTDYDVKAYADEGTQKLYQGPGTKYGEVPGVREIENGETLHITQDAELVDGSHWGVTTVDGTEGWMDLEKTEEWRNEHPMPIEEAAVDVGETATTTPEATVTGTATETPEPTVTEAATETPEPTVTEKATATPTATDTPEPTVTEAATETPESSSNPIMWILLIIVIAAAVILYYRNKNKKK